MSNLKFVTVGALSALILSMCACGRVGSASEGSPHPLSSPRVTSDGSSVEPLSGPRRAPVRACVAADISKSMKGTHTAQLRAEDLTPILDLLERNSARSCAVCV